MTSATSAAYEINQVYINPWKCDVKSISVAIVQIFILFMKRIRVEIVRKCGERESNKRFYKIFNCYSRIHRVQRQNWH